MGRASDFTHRASTTGTSVIAAFNCHGFTSCDTFGRGRRAVLVTSPFDHFAVSGAISSAAKSHPKVRPIRSALAGGEPEGCVADNGEEGPEGLRVISVV